MALQHRNSNAIATQRDGVYEADEGVVLHGHDLRPPVLVLAQGTSASGTPGRFIRKDTEEEFESLEIVPLRVQAVRTHWGEGGFDRDRKPLCFSLDGVRAAMSFQDGTPTEFPGRLCVQCDFYTNRPWEQKANDGWCPPGYNVLVADVNSFDVYIMRLQSTQARFGRIFGAKGTVRSAVMELSAERVTNNSGTFFAMKAKTVRRMDEGEKAVIDGLYDDFRRMEIAVTDEEPVETLDVQQQLAARPKPAPQRPMPTRPSPVPPAASVQASEPAPSEADMPDDDDSIPENIQLPW